MLSAIASINGLSDVSSKRNIWVARRTPFPNQPQQILPEAIAIYRQVKKSPPGGPHVLTGPVHTLDIETGVGANRTKDQNDIYETAAIATLGGKYVWKISPNAEFSQTLRAEAGVTNVYVNPISALKLTVIGNLFATFNHEVRYNTEVPAETRHVDQITTINLGYAFGTPPS